MRRCPMTTGRRWSGSGWRAMLPRTGTYEEHRGRWLRAEFDHLADGDSHEGRGSRRGRPPSCRWKVLCRSSILALTAAAVSSALAPAPGGWAGQRRVCRCVSPDIVELGTHFGSRDIADSYDGAVRVDAQGDRAKSSGSSAATRTDGGVQPWPAQPESRRTARRRPDVVGANSG